MDRLVTRVPAQAERLIDLLARPHFDPARSWAVPDQVTAGLDTVAVRMPRHPVALAPDQGCRCAGGGTQRQSFGQAQSHQRPPCFTDLAGRVNLVLDGGRAEVGLEFTVLDLTGDCP